MLRDPEGARGQLAVPDLRAGRPAQVPPVPQEGRRHEAHPERHQVGARQLCSLDSRGGCWDVILGEGKKLLFKALFDLEMRYKRFLVR